MSVVADENVIEVRGRYLVDTLCGFISSAASRRLELIR